MKTSIKKLAALTAAAIGLAGASMSSQAIITGVPGEAALIPLFYWNQGNRVVDPSTTASGLGNVNTVVRITVPRSIGVDTVTNFFTAPHVTPNTFQDGGEIQAGLKGYQSGDLNLHWIFLNENSKHVKNGRLSGSPDDVDLLTASWLLEEWENTPGYLLVVTEKAYSGRAAADFAFFADAWLTFEPPETMQTPRIVNIPALPLADGQDVSDDGNNTPKDVGPYNLPTLTNNVITNTTLVGINPVASPWVSGIRLVDDGTRVIDLALTSRWSGHNYGTLAVIWKSFNDNIVDSAYEYNRHEEEKCSFTGSLPKQLNIAYIPKHGTLYDPTLPQKNGQGDFNISLVNGTYKTPTDATVQNNGSVWNLCDTDDANEGNFQDPAWIGHLFGEGYIKLGLRPTQFPNAAGQVVGAAVAFSIPLQRGPFPNGTVLPAADDQKSTYGSYISYGSILGHDRGEFQGW